MKTFIPWQRVAETGRRVAVTGAGRLLEVGGRLLQVGGTACTRLGELVRKKARNGY